MTDSPEDRQRAYKAFKEQANGLDLDDTLDSPIDPDELERFRKAQASMATNKIWGKGTAQAEAANKDLIEAGKKNQAGYTSGQKPGEVDYGELPDILENAPKEQVDAHKKQRALMVQNKPYSYSEFKQQYS